MVAAIYRVCLFKRIYEKTFLGYCHRALCITRPSYQTGKGTRSYWGLPTDASYHWRCPIWLFLIIYIIFVSFYFQYALGLFDWMLYQYPIVLFSGRIAVVWIYRWQWKKLKHLTQIDVPWYNEPRYVCTIPGPYVRWMACSDRRFSGLRRRIYRGYPAKRVISAMRKQGG